MTEIIASDSWPVMMEASLAVVSEESLFTRLSIPVRWDHHRLHTDTFRMGEIEVW